MVDGVLLVTGTDFHRFGELIVRDDYLRERLRAHDDDGAFVDAVVVAARERGFDVDAMDVSAALAEGAHSWLGRHVPGW
jgi:hypothetical protein